METDYGSYNTFAVILTATNVEEESILQRFEGWRLLRIPGDNQRYFETFLEAGGEQKKLITARQEIMGMTATSALAMKATRNFRPKYLFMAGIAAGINSEKGQMYGDVLIPDTVWDYSTGKYVGPDESEIRFGDIGFLPRPTYLKTDPGLLETIKKTMDDPENEFHLQIGPLACGTNVVANAQVVDKQVRALFPKTIGLDMESYGVYYAAANAVRPRPKPLVIKSICDYANSEKDDRFQRFAAYTSSGYVKYLLEKWL